MRRPTRRLVATLAVAPLLLGACASGGDPGGQAGATFHGNRLGDPLAVPDTTLSATGGSSYSLTESTDDPVTLVFFGYTHCPDICGMVMSNVASALTRLDEGARDDVEVLFVTTDPARDDEATLRRYLDRFDPSFTGLTGGLDEIVALGRELGVYIEKGEKLPSGGYDVAHTDSLFAIGEADEVPVIWSRDVSAADLAADLATMLAER